MPPKKRVAKAKLAQQKKDREVMSADAQLAQAASLARARQAQQAAGPAASARRADGPYQTSKEADAALQVRFIRCFFA